MTKNQYFKYFGPKNPSSIFLKLFERFERVIWMAAVTET